MKYICTHTVLQRHLGKAGRIDERADCETCEEKECVLCGSKLGRGARRCPRCGNVFTKDEDKDQSNHD